MKKILSLVGFIVLIIFMPHIGYSCDMIALKSLEGNTISSQNTVEGDYNDPFDFFNFMIERSDSLTNNDGYGILYYKDGDVLIDSTQKWYKTGFNTWYGDGSEDPLDTAIVEIMDDSNNAVIVFGHDRNATSNIGYGSHPLTFEWHDATYTFMHNGSINHNIKIALMEYLGKYWFLQHPSNWHGQYGDVNSFIDSELLFHYIMKNIIENEEDVILGISDALNNTNVGGNNLQDLFYSSSSVINFILSDGKFLYIFRNSTVNGSHHNLSYQIYDSGFIAVKTQESLENQILPNTLMIITQDREPYFVTIFNNTSIITWHVSTTGSNSTGDGSEDNPFATIQHGIDVANDGDVVLVHEGTYRENITFNGKNIIVGSLTLTTGDTSYISQTVIDGNQNGSVVTFMHGEDSTAALIGFSITNGNGTPYGDLIVGGGIFCLHSNPLLSNLIVKDNIADDYGGGIFCEFYNPTLVKSRISNNIANKGGGGLYCASSNIILRNILINGNVTGEGGGIFCNNGDPYVMNVTISGNSARVGGGIQCFNSSNPILVNTILWNNSPEEICFSRWEVDLDTNTITISYSDIQGDSAGIETNDNGTVYWLEGNIDADPLFVNPENGDYHLQWGSPCIDTGDPDLNGDGIIGETNHDEQDPDGTRMDMGVYYFDQSVFYVSITLTPYNPLIEIPTSGGTFDYNVLIANNTNITQTFYAVLFADMLNGGQYGSIDPTSYQIHLLPGHTVDVDLIQNVPGNAPAGDYRFYCLVGIDYDTIVDSSGFTFTKLGTVQAAGTGDWISYYSDVGVEMRENDLWTVDGIYREDGTSIYGIIGYSDEISLPESFVLYQNYPNPFNPTTTIRYELPEQSHVTIVIYDMLGREVKELVSGELVSGYHKAVWDGTDSFGKLVGVGVYLYQIKASDFTQTRKMLLLK